jgi:Asp-tRNA(Asn)/Glu-tRNA(Gln) amidotransferase A subunit family amidase
MLSTLLLSLFTSAALQDSDGEEFGPFEIGIAAEILGLEFSESELELMFSDVAERLAEFERLRAIPLGNGVRPALVFQPIASAPVRAARKLPNPIPAAAAPLVRPDDLEELAFASIDELSQLLLTRQVSCLELTEMFLARLERLDEKLFCVITLTPERALEQARARDRELDATPRQWRGPLHGIPWVAKDLLAVKGYPTTWGARPYEHQTLEFDAAVVERLDEAGAVLIAKTTLGALAWGDVWFGGTTRNPWNLEEGSSGSSAGPAAAVAAGCAPFAIGSETLGSIVSPSNRCGNSSLRPSFGRVSRHGAMALAWSMDKLGPLCRSALDAGRVFEAIAGRDVRDPATRDAAFSVNATSGIEGWKIGVPRGAFEGTRGEPFRTVLAELEGLGAELVPLKLPDYPVAEMMIILTAEAGAAFDDFTRADRDDELVRQIRQAWPNVLRHAKLIPAVDYIRANRLRTLLIAEFDAAIEGLHAVVHPSFSANVLETTNLTGHPTFVAPCGFNEDGTPYSISFTGQLDGETHLIALATAWQNATEYHRRHPAL